MKYTDNEKMMAALAYLFWVVSGIFLLLTEKKSKYIRFHAMQSVLTGVVLFALLLIPVLGQTIIPLAILVLWLFLMYKAYSGEMFKIPVIGDFAEQQLKNMK